MKFRKDNGPFNIFAEAETTIEFFDLDPMQIVWHGNYINYFEIGRRTLLEKIGYSYKEMKTSGFAFPIVEVSVKYLKPLQCGDRIRIKAVLIEYENCLRMKYEIINIETGLLTTKGLSTQMAYDIKAGESCFVCPEALSKKVEAIINLGAECRG
ncbi:MAG: acyl-CoA thioesterase [Spirochaetes bacterium]|nr:acyl-CoA thioesterase [Spirochaetota bacterium]